MNANYGHFEIDTLGSSYNRYKRVWNTEPKICKQPDLIFGEGGIRTKGDFKEIYQKKNIIGLDNSRDIFKKIECLKKEIDRYNEIGVEVIRNRWGDEIHTINWNKVAINTEKELEELYDRL